MILASSIGLFVGIIVGVVVLIVTLAIIVLCCCCKPCKTQRPPGYAHTQVVTNASTHNHHVQPSGSPSVVHSLVDITQIINVSVWTGSDVNKTLCWLNWLMSSMQRRHISENSTLYLKLTLCNMYLDIWKDSPILKWLVKTLFVYTISKKTQQQQQNKKQTKQMHDPSYFIFQMFLWCKCLLFDDH